MVGEKADSHYESLVRVAMNNEAPASLAGVEGKGWAREIRASKRRGLHRIEGAIELPINTHARLVLVQARSDGLEFTGNVRFFDGKIVRRTITVQMTGRPSALAGGRELIRFEMTHALADLLRDVPQG